MIKILEPEVGEYHSYYQKYIDKVEGDPVHLLSNQIDLFTDYIKNNAHRMDYRYGEDKWSIRESLIHVVDTEQIFAYRALRISRGDHTPMASFDQDKFISNNDFKHIHAWDILEEFTHQRRASISMIKKFTEKELLYSGVASDSPVTVRALIYMIAGHAQHHIDIFNDRY